MSLFPSLPKEIPELILEHVHPRQLFELAKLNRSWSKTIKSMGAMYLNIPIFHSPGVADQVIAFIDRDITSALANCSNKQQPVIRYILVNTLHMLFKRVFEHIQRRCPDVVYFDYEYGYIDGLPNRKLHFFLSGNCPWTSIRYLPACYRERCGERRFQNLSSLVSLYARKNYFDYEWRRTRSGGAGGFQEHIIMFALPSLETLVLDKAIHIHPEDIKYIHAQCPKLKSLVVRSDVV
jgi:hypothetical protein